MVDCYTDKGRTYFKFKCKEDHEFTSRWDGGIRWCKICGNTNRRKYNYEDILEICKEKNITLLSKNYTVQHDSLKFKCHLGHNFSTEIKNIVDDKFCRACSKMKHDINTVNKECEKRGIICLENIYKGINEPMKFKMNEKEEIMTFRSLKRNCIKCSTTRATFNLKGHPPKFCMSCATPEMVDVESKMCDSCNLYRANKQFDNTCLICFMFNNPDHNITRKYRKKEMYIVEKIREKFPDLNMTFNKTVGGCSKRRPDIHIELFTHSIIIEIDENQHTSYECEEIRTNQLFTDLADRPLVLIRFNPDKYKNEDGKVIRGIFTFDNENNIKIFGKKECEKRLLKLFETIKDNINIKSELMTEFKLFYD